MYNALTDIPGLSVGHWTDLDAATGCTVILCPDGAVAGADVRGGAPGTREIALLDPTCTVDRVHAVLLGGGSAFGLAAAGGVMRWLEERGHGFATPAARVPIVPSAILFDLALGRADVRPDADAGYAACQAASNGAVAEGCVGAGTGATVGKALGFAHATKSGLGTASHTFTAGGEEPVTVAALAAVNAFGDVLDPQTGQIIAGARDPEGEGYIDTMRVLTGHTDPEKYWGGNTTIAVVATNAALTKVQTTKVAQMAHDGLARTIRPVHTAIDGDVVFALSLGQAQADASLIGAVAADVLSQAIVRAVRTATPLHNVPTTHDHPTH